MANTMATTTMTASATFFNINMYASNAGTSHAVIRDAANEERSMTEMKKKNKTLLA